MTAGVSRTPSATKVADLLGEEVRLLGAFVDLLRQEQQSLQQGTVDALVALAEKKSVMANQLTDLQGQREDLLATAGLGKGRAAMDAWLMTTAPDRRPRWQELLRLAEEARNLNELNGKLIGIQMQNNQQALAALLNAGGQFVTYGPDGQQTAGGGGRSFGAV